MQSVQQQVSEYDNFIITVQTMLDSGNVNTATAEIGGYKVDNQAFRAYTIDHCITLRSSNLL